MIRRSARSLLAAVFFLGVVTTLTAAAGWLESRYRVRGHHSQGTDVDGRLRVANAPSEGAQHDLWAKALALSDPEGKKGVLVTLDVCGIDREFSNRIRDALQARFNLPRDQVVLVLLAHAFRAGSWRQPDHHVSARRGRAARIRDYARIRQHHRRRSGRQGDRSAR